MHTGASTARASTSCACTAPVSDRTHTAPRTLNATVSIPGHSIAAARALGQSPGHSIAAVRALGPGLTCGIKSARRQEQEGLDGPSGRSPCPAASPRRRTNGGRCAPCPWQCRACAFRRASPRCRHVIRNLLHLPPRQAPAVGESCTRRDGGSAAKRPSTRVHRPARSRRALFSAWARKAAQVSDLPCTIRREGG